MRNKAIVEFEEEECIDNALMFDETQFRDEDEEGLISVEPYIEDLSVAREKRPPSPI